MQHAACQLIEPCNSRHSLVSSDEGPRGVPNLDTVSLKLGSRSIASLKSPETIDSNREGGPWTVALLRSDPAGNGIPDACSADV